MASTYVIEVKVISAQNLKNVKGRNGHNSPYVAVWVDPRKKYLTCVSQSSGTHAIWDEKLMMHTAQMTIIDNTTLFLEVFHAVDKPNNNPIIIGSAHLPLIEIGVDERVTRTLSLMRPSGRQQGIVEVNVVIKDICYHAPRDAYHTSAYGVPPTPTTRSPIMV
jgi:hypothetical protein